MVEKHFTCIYNIFLSYLQNNSLLFMDMDMIDQNNVIGNLSQIFSMMSFIKDFSNTTYKIEEKNDKEDITRQ